MRKSMSTFVRSPLNDAVFRAIDSLGGLRPLPLRLFIEGPRGAGKTTLVHSLAEDAARNGGEMAFACSGADIAMAIQFEADDSFFERLGSAPVLLVDDLAPLFGIEQGDQLLGLLLAERDRLGLSTIITADEPPNTLQAPQSKDALLAFDVQHFYPLDDEGRLEFARLAMQEYQGETSPALDDGALSFIVREAGASFPDMEDAIRYLMTDGDCSSHGTIDEPLARRLLQK